MGLECSCFSSETTTGSIDFIDRSSIMPLKFEPPEKQQDSKGLKSLSRKYLAQKSFQSLTDPKNKYESFNLSISSFEPSFLNSIEKSLPVYPLPEIPGPVYLLHSDYYQGSFNKRCQKSGYGILITKENRKYTGQFKNNKYHGQGRLIFENGDVYEGTFKRNKANGPGKFIQNNGLVYEGEFKDDKQHGKGVEVWGEGYRYEGEYFKGQKHGTGFIQYANGSSYQGEFCFNKVEGRGLYRWNELKWYDGEFVDNKMQGFGELHSQSGLVYKGEFWNDQKNGFGVCKWPDGRGFKGQWKNDYQDGEGVFKFVNRYGERVKRTGVWNMGKRERWTDGGIEDTMKLSLKNINFDFNV